jgi:hypothetical protein
MRSLPDNKEAVSVTVGYIIFSGVYLMFFIIVLLNADDLLIQSQKSMVMEDQFRDIGNMMSNTITDMYLIAPENGMIDTAYIIPDEIGKETYTINTDLAFIDQVIEVKSLISDKSVSITINGIASTISISGTAYSSSPTHRISYNSNSTG